MGCFVLSIAVVTRLACFRRKRLLGRNLITLFQSVNTFSKIFFARPPPLSRHSRPPFGRRTCRHAHDNTKAADALLKNTAFHAVLLRPVRKRSPTSALHALRFNRFDDVFQGVNEHATAGSDGKGIGRFISPNARICANFFCLSEVVEHALEVADGRWTRDPTGERCVTDNHRSIRKSTGKRCHLAA